MRKDKIILVSTLVTAGMLVLLSSCSSGIAQSDYDAVKSQLATAQQKVTSLQGELDSANKQSADLQQQLADEQVTVGGALYQTYCSKCHGTNGAGGIQIGEATSADIRYATLNDMYKGDWSLANQAILTGKDEENEDLDTAMPRFQGTLSDTQVDAIVQYLQTLK